MIRSQSPAMSEPAPQASPATQVTERVPLDDPRVTAELARRVFRGVAGARWASTVLWAVCVAHLVFDVPLWIPVALVVAHLLTMWWLVVMLRASTRITDPGSGPRLLRLFALYSVASGLQWAAIGGLAAAWPLNQLMIVWIVMSALYIIGSLPTRALYPPAMVALMSALFLPMAPVLALHRSPPGDAFFIAGFVGLAMVYFVTR